MKIHQEDCGCSDECSDDCMKCRCQPVAAPALPEVAPEIADEYQLIYHLMKHELERGRSNGLANEHAIELIEKYSALKSQLAAAKGGWIEIKEGSEMPKDGTNVLVFTRYWSNEPFVAYREEGEWYGDRILSRPSAVTHWAPLLPTPPDNKGDGK